MSPSDSPNAGGRRRIRFVAVPVPEPPSDDELLQFGRGDFRGLDVEAIATLLARDPAYERRMEALLREAEARPVGLPVAVPLLDQIRVWLQEQGRSLAASVELAGAQLRSSWSQLWEEVALPPLAAATTRGKGGPTEPEVRPILQLRDPKGRTITVERFRSGYRVEIDLKDRSPRETTTYLEVEPLPCPHLPPPTFRTAAPVDERGIAAFARCPGGLYRIHGEGFDFVLHLAPLPAERR